MMSKQCRNCGAELPDDAAFCPHCTQVQQEKAYRRPPRRWRKYLLLGVLAVCLIGPCNGSTYMRYLYPVIACMPFAIGATITRSDLLWF